MVQPSSLWVETGEYRLAKVSKWILRILRFLKLIVPDKVEKISSITVECKNIERYIVENHHRLISRYDARDVVILIGAKQFDELQSCVVDYPMKFDMSYHGSRFRGLSVVVLPWMDGTLLVPRNELSV